MKIVLLLLIAIVLWAKTIVVDTECSTSFFSDRCEDGSSCEVADSGCNSSDDRCNFKTIKSALEYLEDGDTIRICKGEYQEDGLIIDKNSVTIESVTNNPNDVQIGNKNSWFPFVNLFLSNHIFLVRGYIQDLTIKGISIGQDSSSYDAIYIENGKDINLLDLDIESKRDGLSQRDVTGDSQLDNLYISGTQIKAKNYAIYLKTPNNLLVDDVNLTSTDDIALMLDNPNGKVTITNSKGDKNYINSFNSSINLGNQEQINIIEHSDFTLNNDNAGAVTFSSVNQLNINDIIVHGDNKGVGVWSSGVISGDLNISNSSIYDSKNEAIYIKRVDGSTHILNNEILKAGIDAIRIDDSIGGGEIKQNIIKEANSYGLRLLSSQVERDFQIDHNCFIDNGINALSQDEGANFDDGAEGNYWDNWSGSGSYRVENIPRYDYHPLRECNLNGSSEVRASFNAVSSIGEDNLCDSVKDWSNNLTTQIVNRDFDLYILSRDDESNLSLEANISRVTLNYYSSGHDNSCLGEKYKTEVVCDGNCGNTNINGCLHIANVKSNRAVKCVEVEIIGRVGSAVAYDKSIDNFAIRPYGYLVLLDNNISYAGDSFKLDIKALDNNSNASLDYNESEDDSFRVNFNDIKSNCITGYTLKDVIKFSDGDSGEADISYSEIRDSR